VLAGQSWIDAERAFGGTVAQPKSQRSVHGLVDVPLLDLAAWAATGQAGDRVDVESLSAADVRKQVAVAAGHAYLAVIAQRRQVAIDETSRDNARAQFDYANTLFEGGGGSRLNALRASEVLATDEVLVERSRFALRLAQEALGVLLAADAPVDAGPEPSFDIPLIEGEPDLARRTDVMLYGREVEARERVLRDSWRDWMPTLHATFGSSYVDPPGAFEDDRTWRAFVGVRLPIYLGGLRPADRLFRVAELESARIDLDETTLAARSEVRVFREAVAAAERGLVKARAAADAAAEVLEITDIAFRAGATTNIELIDAQRRARDSETAAALAADLLRQAKLELLVALGLFPE
jgi:outer membrane protein TolC